VFGSYYKLLIYIMEIQTYQYKANKVCTRCVMDDTVQGITFDDTEHAKFELLIYPLFTDVLLNPKCFQKDLGSKQIRFDSYMEFSYLHPDFFKPNDSIRALLGISKSDKFVLFRFIS